MDDITVRRDGGYSTTAECLHEPFTTKPIGHQSPTDIEPETLFETVLVQNSFGKHN